MAARSTKPEFRATGLLLLNLGTPDAPTTRAVRKYLREFLMDPLVIDIPWAARWLTVHAVILPRRPAASAELYQKIWTERGSPLLFHLRDLVDQVAPKLGPGWAVEGAMRYGSPSIETGLRALLARGAEELVIFPLYPQYSLAATESSIVAVQKAVHRLAPGMPLRFIEPFYEDPGLIEGFARQAERTLADFVPDQVIFSFHGLPVRQVQRTDKTGRHCLASMQCCEQLGEVNRDCYRAQCYATARKIATRLGLVAGKYSVAFQSRLGRTEWIRPYTDDLYRDLPKKGVRRLAVLCPAFVADCLETLEEVALRGRDEFVAHGGEELRLVPSLNATDLWVDTVVRLARGAP